MPIPDFQNAPVVVTGGAGFIGSHLVDALLARGANVTVLDDLSTGAERNLEHHGGRIRFLKGDIRDAAACHEAVSGARYVFHLAARGSVPRSLADPVPTIDINVRGTATVFSACRGGDDPIVVFASSSSVYGDSTRLPKREGEEGRPLSPYALSKSVGEQLAETFWRCYGTRVVALRYFNVFGPRQSPNGPYAAVVPRFFSAIRRGESPVIYGDGEQSRDFTFVADVVHANLLAAGAPPDAWGSAFNVAPGSGVTVNALASTIRTACGGGPGPTHQPARAGDVLHSRADSSRADAVLGFRASIALDEGIRRTADAFA